MPIVLMLALIVSSPERACSSRTLTQSSQAPTPATQTQGDIKPAEAKPAEAKSAPDSDKERASDSDGDRRRPDPDRIFGILPNYTTVEHGAGAPPIQTKQTFALAAFNSFDPYVFPFVGVVAGFAQVTRQEMSWGTGASAYGKRYAMALSDNTIGNFMTTAIVPAALKQDPRYFALGTGNVFRRTGYAASRSVVTRGRDDGRRELNISEIGGNTLAAVLASSYHPREDRTPSAMLARAGTQIMWDTLANELKEFWPDIRQKLHRHSPQPQAPQMLAVPR